MKIINYFIGFIVYTLIVAIISIYLWDKYHGEPTIKIVEKKVYETKYIKKNLDKLPIPDGYQKLKTCYLSSLNIYTEMVGQTLHIVARDHCKETRSDVTLAVQEKSGNWKLYGMITGVSILLGGYGGYKAFENTQGMHNLSFKITPERLQKLYNSKMHKMFSRF